MPKLVGLAHSTDASIELGANFSVSTAGVERLRAGALTRLWLFDDWRHSLQLPASALVQKEQTLLLKCSCGLWMLEETTLTLSNAT